MSGLFLFLDMKSFLEEVVTEIWKKQGSFAETIFILPSKRAGTFLRDAIARTSKKTMFAPEIYSIESFVESISGLKYASNTQQLFELFKVYKTQNPKENYDFFTFSKWAQTLLHDFNEVDRYLVDAQKIFANLSDIQKISHWSPDSPKTKMMDDYQQFWGTLFQLYQSFNESLLNKNLGHQGLVYRQAVQMLPSYIDSNLGKKHIFIGFNALNKAETFIIQGLLKDEKNEIYWDLDHDFLNDIDHDAGFFMRRHLNTWPQLKSLGLKGLGNYFSDDKNIHVVGVPKNVSQAKYVGSLLSEFQYNKGLVKNTAVVLGEESLLNPILNAIPEEIEGVNITMGYPLKNISLASFFHQFIDLYLKKDGQGWFYKTILSFLSHPYCQIVLEEDDKNYADAIINSIKRKNWAYVDWERIITFVDRDQLNLIYFEAIPTPIHFIQKCLEIILDLKSKLQNGNDTLALEHLYRFYTLFNQLYELIHEYDFIDDLKALKSLYTELLSSETLDFRGEPLQGLQIMGMLESRNLDFETVIITSVNEGVLPSGKTNNSFIPFDLKLHFGLPTYKEKDAVYTYHFYRLLQRAKNIYVLYNTEPDVLEGGERSRLISQLLTDKNLVGKVSEMIVAPAIEPTENLLENIAKDEALLQRIQEYAARGFSPTALTNYIRNPIDFYKKNLLGIDDLSDVEETIAANTFGTIVHDTLEEIYTPFIDKVLTTDLLIACKSNIRAMVQHHFSKSYAGGDISHGKNLIAFNVVVRYIENFIDLEIKEVEKHKIIIKGLERSFKINLDLPELDFPVVLRGKLDRIDEKDGTLRIIDYKTGKVDTKNVTITDWNDIITEYDQSKAFQLLCYAKMYGQQEPFDQIEAGIITFKNLSSGLLHFGTKPSKNSRSVDSAITSETIDHFSDQLQKLILEICNPDIPFMEKEA